MLCFSPLSRPGFASLLFCTLLLLCTFLSPALAQETLILELPPSRAARAQKAQEAAARQAEERARTPVRRTATTRRGSLPSRGGFRRDANLRSQDQNLGRLGVLTRTAPIYRGRSTKTPLLTRSPAGTYVALQQQSNGWYGVLMADGTLGWVQRAHARALDYEVIGAQTEPQTTTPGEEPGDIYPRTDNAFFVGDAGSLLSEAYKYLGVRYVWGGNTFRGIDCSGFVKNVYGAQGFPLPRLGSDQMAYGQAIPRDQLQPGDRIYFGRRKDNRTVSHTGIYVGNGYFIHASSSQRGVVISHLTEKMWSRLYVCARR